MTNTYMLIRKSAPLVGTCLLNGAKNAVLPIMASLILTEGKSILRNVPYSTDVQQMASILKYLGASVTFLPAEKELIVDTRSLNRCEVDPALMNKMRASILVMGPLLARFGRAQIALPGGCGIGARPIDYHIKHFKRMGVSFERKGATLFAYASKLSSARFVLEYPSVGTTENLIMASVFNRGITYIINASLEPEVRDLITVLQKMGASIKVKAPGTIEIVGTKQLQPVTHTILPDRLEAGGLLVAAAATGGAISLPELDQSLLDLFLFKLQEMGHTVMVGDNGIGVHFIATEEPQAVSFKTGPFPGFPTDLQAPMMALQAVAYGSCVIEETVFENRLIHADELNRMGAQIKVKGNQAQVRGVRQLHGTHVRARDIRSSCGLLIAGLIAQGETRLIGLDHLYRGYDQLDKKLKQLGADITIETGADYRKMALVECGI